jgi:hypothetical protein
MQMALSKEAAKKIIDVVSADPACIDAMKWNLSDNEILNSMIPTPVQNMFGAAKVFMAQTGTAGGVRNSGMLARGKEQGDAEFDKKACYGISLVTMKAILKAMSAKQLPEVSKCSTIHRVTGAAGVHHDATRIMTPDECEYVFDWHATLKPADPIINTDVRWLDGKWGFNYSRFSGFD